MTEFGEAVAAALAGGPERHREKTAEQGKLPVRERVARLVDPGSFAEEGLLANWEQEGLGADGVLTGLARIDSRPVALMANDPTVKAGSWGPKTVEKILRVQERALKLQVPLVYMVDSAGRADHRPGADVPRAARRRPHLPQRGAPLRPGAAGLPAARPERRGRRLHPRLLRRGDHARRQRLDVPGLAADGGDGDRREGDAGGDGRGADAHRRLRLRPLPGQVRRGGDRPGAALPLLHAGQLARASRRPRRPRRRPPTRRSPRSSRPTRTSPSTCARCSTRCSTPTRFLEVHKRWAKELLVGYGRLDGRAVGIVANQPRQKGGVLFVDSADKAARFIQTCNAFNVPLLFLADVPGFMIGTAVERHGIIRHGAKMISAVSEATVPKISVIVRKAYGAGLYAMAGPAFEPDCCIALPGASIAVMGPQAAVNAVFFNQIQAIEDEAEREAFVAAQARGVRGRHRPPAPRLGARRRRHRRAGGAARRPDPALRPGRRRAPRVRHPAQSGHPGLRRSAHAAGLRYRSGMSRNIKAPLLAAIACAGARSRWLAVIAFSFGPFKECRPAPAAAPRPATPGPSAPHSPPPSSTSAISPRCWS